MLFSNERKHNVTLPAQLDNGSQPNIAYLLRYLVDNVMKDQRQEMFIMEDNVYVDYNVWIKQKLTTWKVDQVFLC